MEVHREVVAAIEKFDAWDRPWEFYASVSSLLGPGARSELERIWATATDSAGWSTCEDLAQGCSLTEIRLAQNFPWLSAKSRKQLGNGAAYQWR
jgi:hypothetical protein